MYQVSATAAILTSAVSSGAALGFGWGVLRLLRVRGRFEPLGVLYAAALGLGVLAYLVLGLGLTARLQSAWLAGVLVAGWVLLIPAARDGLKALRSRPREAGEAASPPPGPPPVGTSLSGALLAAYVLGGYLALLAIVTLVAAFRPPDGMEWDSLSYHLAAPKIFLREGRVPFIAYDSHTHFPFTVQMLYTLGLSFGGVAGAKLFHWLMGWLTILGVWAITARQTVTGQRLPPWAGPAAAAAFASMPVVLWELGTAYVDLGTALFQLLALAALVGALEHQDARDGRPAGWRVRPEIALLAGILSGFALGTKMTALLQFGLLGLGLLWLLARAPAPLRRQIFRGAALFSLAGLAVASPWYIKSWLWVNNPVYPFFFSLFPNSYSWTAEAASEYAKEQHAFGLGKGPGEFLNVFWNLGMQARAFFVNERALAGDKLGSLGPLWVALLPLLFWCRRLGWVPLLFLGYALASIGLWFFLSQQVRYLTPVFAPLAVTLAVVLCVVRPPALRIAARGFFAAALALNFLMHWPVAQFSMQPVLNPDRQSEYLRVTLPGLYEASEYVNRMPEDVRIALYQETRGFYFDRNYFWANPLQHNLIPYARLTTGDELATELQRFGITHVLINYDFCQGLDTGEGAGNAQWYRLLMHGIQQGTFNEVFRSTGATFGTRGVMIYRIEPVRPQPGPAGVA
jgi:hypothetical protein